MTLPNSNRLPQGISDGERVYIGALADGLRPDPELSVSAWAEQHRVLSGKASSEAGPWRTSRTPYLQEIMDCLSAHSPVRDVVLMKGSQVGGTEVALNFIGYVIGQTPGPIMLVWPTSVAAKRNSKQRITPLIEESPQLRGRVKSARSRDSGNTTLMKEFTGGVLVIAGANSATELKSTPARFLICDEVDEYPPDVDNQGDPIDLAKKRTTNFPRAKRLYISTPTVKDFSNIDALYSGSDDIQASDQRHCYVPCPECEHEQVLQWDRFGWETRKAVEYHCTHCGAISDGAPAQDEAEHVCPECGESGEVTNQVLVYKDTGEVTRVWYECEHCSTQIEEYHKTWMFERYRWIAHNPGPNRAAGFHLPSFYAPLGWYSWREVVVDFLKSERNDEKRKVWWNTVAGLPYEDKGEQPSHAEVAQRAEPYQLGKVPLGALLLVAAVDVQKKRLESKLKAYGRGEESWLIDVQRFYGDPVQQHVWDQLDEYLQKRFEHEAGVQLRIVATAVDSGYQTQEVYHFCRRRHGRFVFPVKGVSGQGRPPLGKPTKQDIDYRGQYEKEGIELWPVGVDTVKGRIYARLRLEEPGPQYMHFPLGLPDEYYEQLTAEKLLNVPTRTGHPRQVWVKKKGAPNEALDLEVYCYAAALFAGMTKVDWDKLEQKLGINQKDLFNADHQDKPQPQGVQPAEDQPAAHAPSEAGARGKPRGGRRVRNAGLSQG